MAVGVLIDATIVRALLVPVADAPARRVELVGAGAAAPAAPALRGPGGLARPPRGARADSRPIAGNVLQEYD